MTERWPADPRRWDLSDTGGASRLQVRVAGGRTERLRVLEPCEQAVYVLTGEDHGDRLRLAASREDGRLWWYLDGRYIGDSTPAAPLYLDLEPGVHRIACMARDGARDTASFTVERPRGAVEVDG